MGHAVYRVVCPRSDGDRDANATGEVLRAHISLQSRALYYAKVDTTDVATVGLLGDHRFHVVDVNVTLRFAGGHARARGPSDVIVVELRPDHARAVLEIAGSTFEYSRFHLDPNIPRTVADRVKREWIQSYVDRARGDCLFVALVGGEPAGFLAALCGGADGRSTAAIDLVGVATSCRRRGAGRALVDAFVETYLGRCEVLEVGTQIANVPSLRLYESLGFAVHRSAYVMHRHVGVGS